MIDCGDSEAVERLVALAKRRDLGTKVVAVSEIARQIMGSRHIYRTELLEDQFRNRVTPELWLELLDVAVNGGEGEGTDPQGPKVTKTGKLRKPYKRRSRAKSAIRVEPERKEEGARCEEQ